MRIRQSALVFLSVVLVATSSFASICDVSCSFAQLHSGRGSTANGRAATTAAAAAKMNMAEGMDHSCCLSRDDDSAIVAPHVSMFPDCAVDPSLRLYFPAAVGTPGTPVVIHAMQFVRSGFDSKAAEAPPLAANSLSTGLASLNSVLSSVLRI